MKRIGKMKRFCAMLLATVIIFSGAGFNAGNAYATELDPSVVEAVDIEAAETEVNLENVVDSLIDEAIVQDEVNEGLTEEESVVTDSNVEAEESEAVESEEVDEEEVLEIAEEVISDEAALEDATETVKFFKVQKVGEGSAVEYENWDEVLAWFNTQTSEGEYTVTVDNSDPEVYFGKQSYKNGVVGELPSVKKTYYCYS